MFLINTFDLESERLENNEELEALFYVALLILTLITLALALVLRESPQF